MNKINNLIAPAIAFIDSTKSQKGKDDSFFKENGKVAKEYKGYISSFGAAVLQSGLKVGVALFSDSSSGGEQSKLPIMNGIRGLVLSDEEKNKYKTLMEFVIAHHHNGIRNKVLDATIALKLALRTFEFDK